MPYWKPTALALFGTLTFAAPAWADTSPFEGLMDTIVTWLSANFELPANYDHPEIRLEPAAYISNVRYGTSKPGMRREVVAIYDDTSGTIFLADNWRGRTPAETSVLVHEMVHHLQNRGNLSYGCPRAREELAYLAQERWLGMFGENLHDAFDIDDFVLMLSTNCLIR